ncbi:MAG: MliC family protein [Alkalispirochaeta sp.]
MVRRNRAVGSAFNFTVAIIVLTGVVLSSCAGGPAARPAASAPAGQSVEQSGDTDDPTDLSSAAAQAFADAADDGTAAFCAPGRYTVRTEQGVDFAMVSWGNQVQLTLLDTPASQAARAASDLDGLSGEPPSLTLNHVESASGAKYVGGPDDQYLFWSKGDRATVQLGSTAFEDARVRPLATGR